MVAPYIIDVPKSRLASLRTKLEAYDWSQLPDAGAWNAGIGLRKFITTVSGTST